MPIVQTYGTRKVSTEALPGVRRRAAETPESQGAGVALARARMYEQLGGLGETVARAGTAMFGQIQAEERDLADRMALINAENQLSTWERDKILDPEHGALQVKGRDTLSLRQDVGADFEATADQIAAGLHTDQQRVGFAAMRARFKDNVDGTLERHITQEVRAYDLAELKGLMDNAVDAAVANAQDPRRIAEELNRATTALRKVGPKYGMGPEELDQQESTVRSRAFVGAIDRLLANDQVGRAQALFEETKGQIAGDQLARVERAVEEGGLRQRAQAETDRILKAGGTLTTWREQARGIEDPKLRDEVLQRVEHEAAVRDRLDRDVAEDRLRRAADVIDKTKNVTGIAPADWAALSPGERSALRSYARQLVTSDDVETDLATYYRLMGQAANDPEAFARENLLTSIDKLGKTDFKQLTDLQRAMRTADRKAADKDLAGFRSKDQIIKDTLAQYRIDEKDHPAEVAQLRRMLDLRIDAAQAEGQKVTNTEIQGALDDLLSQSVTIPGSWWNILPGGKPFFDQTKRLVDLTASDIPAQDRAELERALRSKGRPVSDATVLDLYLELLVRRQR